MKIEEKDMRTNENFWRLPGGFLELYKHKSDLEAAYEELLEETGVDRKFVDNVKLVKTQLIDDWRYKGTGEAIKTTLFSMQLKGNYSVKAGDDLEEVQWFPIDELGRVNIGELHTVLIRSVQRNP